MKWNWPSAGTATPDTTRLCVLPEEEGIAGLW